MKSPRVPDAAAAATESPDALPSKSWSCATAGFRRALGPVVMSRPTEDAEYAMRDRIDREREDAGASVDARAGDDSIVAPCDVLDGTWHGDDDVVTRCRSATPPTLPVKTDWTPAGVMRWPVAMIPGSGMVRAGACAGAWREAATMRGASMDSTYHRRMISACRRRSALTNPLPQSGR